MLRPMHKVQEGFLEEVTYDILKEEIRRYREGTVNARQRAQHV